MPFLAAVATTLRQPRCALLDGLPEERVEQQVGQVRVLVEGLLDLAQEQLRMMQPPRHISAMPP